MYDSAKRLWYRRVVHSAFGIKLFGGKRMFTRASGLLEDKRTTSGRSAGFCCKPSCCSQSRGFAGKSLRKSKLVMVMFVRDENCLRHQAHVKLLGPM